MIEEISSVSSRLVFRHNLDNLPRSPGGLNDGGIDNGPVRFPYQNPFVPQAPIDLLKEPLEEIEFRRVFEPADGRVIGKRT